MKKVIFILEIGSGFLRFCPFFTVHALKLIAARVFLILLVFGFIGCEKHLEIPLEVSGSFWAKYENATNIEWSSTDGIYSVSFDLMQHPKSAIFKTEGEWVRTISILSPRRLIVCLQEFVDENYRGMLITEVVFIETSISEKYFITIGVDQEYEKKEPQNEDEIELGHPDKKTEETTRSIVLEFYSNCEFVAEKKH